MVILIKNCELAEVKVGLTSNAGSYYIVDWNRNIFGSPPSLPFYSCGKGWSSTAPLRVLLDRQKIWCFSRQSGFRFHNQVILDYWPGQVHCLNYGSRWHLAGGSKMWSCTCTTASWAPLSNCLIQNGDLGGEGELRNLPLIFVVFCSNYNGAPVKMVSFSTVPPPPVESETLHGRLKRGAG